MGGAGQRPDLYAECVRERGEGREGDVRVCAGNLSLIVDQNKNNPIRIRKRARAKSNQHTHTKRVWH